MRFVTFAAISLALLLPLAILLSVLEYAAFDNDFYEEKFSQYKVDQNVPGYASLHAKIIDFVNGDSRLVPEALNEREKSHLEDVKGLKKAATVTLYVVVALFALLLIVSVFILRVNTLIINFVGKAMVFGGILAILISAALLFLISYDFSPAFESFHKLFFEQGTYTFDPAADLLVRLYPEEIFQDLGLRISKGVIASSLALVAFGALLLKKSKKG